MISESGQEKTETAPQTFSRRDVLGLSRLRRIWDGETKDKSAELVPFADVFADRVIAELKRRKATRRRVVAVGGSAIATGSAYLLVDHALQYLPTSWINSFLTSQEYREKVVQQLQEGGLEELFDDAKNSIESQGEIEKNFELDKKEDLSEPWMSVYQSTECYRLTREDMPMWEERYCMFMELDTVRAFATHIDTYNGEPYANFTKTVDAIDGNIATLPSNQIIDEEDDIEFIREPVFYSAFVLPNGEIVEKFDQTKNFKGKRSPLRGAIVVDTNHKARVCTPEEANEYQIGKNCTAIESCGYIVESGSDMDLIDTLTESNDVVRSPGIFTNKKLFNSATVSFYDNENQVHTYIISRYQHIDVGQKIRKGTNDSGTTLLTLRQLFHLADQFKQQHGFTRLVMQVPDTDFESEIKTSQHFTQEELDTLGDDKKHFMVERKGALRQPISDLETTIGLMPHRVMGDAHAISYPMPKTHFLAATDF